MKRVACLVLLLMFSFPAESHAAKRVALVIGNSAYTNAPLKNPVNDASDVAAKLRGLGFDVTLLTDAGQKQMESGIRNFGAELAQADIRLFYYAGHGMQVSGANYLIPVDADVASEYDVKYESVNVARVLDSMAAAGRGVNVLVLDACRNNPFARSFRSGSRGLARMDSPGGTLLIYATAPGCVAADGQGRNGLFTKHLLDNIDKPGITIDQMFKHTGRGVAAESGGRQEPWISLSLYEDVYLRGNAAPAAPPAAAPTPPTPVQTASIQPFVLGDLVGEWRGDLQYRDWHAWYTLVVTEVKNDKLTGVLKLRSQSGFDRWPIESSVVTNDAVVIKAGSTTLTLKKETQGTYAGPIAYQGRHQTHSGNIRLDSQ